MLLVHGFGASIAHWRFNIPALVEAGHTVWAVDLLGFGGSDKPETYTYTMEGWRDLLLDFVEEFIDEPAVIVGNSIGSLASLMTAAANPSAFAGVVLCNTAGAMNNKAISDDWRLQLARPIFLLIDWLLLQPAIAERLFNGFRTPENIAQTLKNVYSNEGNVDADLVELIYRPSCDAGALDAFVKIITGPPGPRPEDLLPQIDAPLLLLWGDEDPFTPMDGPVAKYFIDLARTRPDTQFSVIPGCGHCPHDDRPDLVHRELLPWLARYGTAA